MDVTLQRVGQSDAGTFGVMLDGEVPFAVTLEDPWNDNQPNVSCIPPGSYVCQRVVSPKFGETFEVTHVPGRSHILFHRGNSTDDTQGCILTGEEFAVRGDGKPIVASSGRAFAEFMDRQRGVEDFLLHIIA